MKSKLILFIILSIFPTQLLAENLVIEAKNITLEKDRVTSIFENEVIIKTKEKVIKSDYVKYNKKTGILIIKDSIKVMDEKNNVVETNYAEYNEKNKKFTSKGPTIVKISEGYTLTGEDILIDNNKKMIVSNKNSTLIDKDKNEIYLENFEYSANSNILKSLGLIKIKDIMGNSYEFSQIYIDTSKKELFGTDIKAYLNEKSFKINEKNKPRVFANNFKLTRDTNEFEKSIFTLCNYRKNDKCPPWTIQSTKMLHDNKKKTIYYDNAVIKVYDIPILYLPKLSHPDPSVDRRSGLLPPTMHNTKNLGTGISIPYFFNLGIDKNFTLINRMYASENPLFLGEYHQVFKNSSLISNFGFTEGYKKTSTTKRAGDKSHFFTKFDKSFFGKNDSKNNLSISLANVSDDKYLKLYKIESNLVDYQEEILENTFAFSHEKNDLFLSVDTTVYESLADSYNDKYEYVLPEITLDKNLLSSARFGKLDLTSNIKVNNYDTNKLTKFWINDFNWNSRDYSFFPGFENNFLANIKNINYETKNITEYKSDNTNEIFGALGLLSEINFQKKQRSSNHFFSPKMLLRYSPGTMRNEVNGSRLTPDKAFSLNKRIDNINNHESGLSATVGFDYKIDGKNKDFDFSIAQIINKVEKKEMPNQTSLNEKLSDLTGKAKINLGNRLELNYNFNIDENYKDFNYNDLGAKLNFGKIDFDFNYLQENKHLGKNDYFNSKITLNTKENTKASFEVKRDLITNSAEFYNLSYEYANDCLRAGLVYRREFYKDSELEPEDSLMFKITLVPFGGLGSATINK